SLHVRILATGEDTNKGLCWLFFSGLAIYNTQFLACVIDEYLFSCLVIEFAAGFHLISPEIVVMRELRIAITVVVLLTVLIPERQQRAAWLLKLCGKVLELAGKILVTIGRYL